VPPFRDLCVAAAAGTSVPSVWVYRPEWVRVGRHQPMLAASFGRATSVHRPSFCSRPRRYCSGARVSARTGDSTSPALNHPSRRSDGPAGRWDGPPGSALSTSLHL